MEDSEWNRDETPYLVFQCSKCQQYSYVKLTQKSKKCLRCRKVHSVETIKGETVYGMTYAVELVKKKQNELAYKELTSAPDLRAYNDFKLAGISKKLKVIEEPEDNKHKFSTQYLKMLKEISNTFKEFPLYVIEVMAENYRIPPSKLKSLTRKFIKKGILVRSKDSTFKLNLT